MTCMLRVCIEKVSGVSGNTPCHPQATLGTYCNHATYTATAPAQIVVYIDILYMEFMFHKE